MGLSLDRQEPVIDVILREAEEVGAKVELLSSKHEAGEIFLKTFNGVAGIAKGRL
jgi:peptide subunit release factor 1 (eRF1)